MHYRAAMVCRQAVRMSLFLALFIFAAMSSPANKKPPPAPINLNTATSEELQQVPGIGPVTAKKILQMRKSYGPFKSVDDLRAIRGIGPKRLEKMRKYLTAGKSAPTKNTQPQQPQTAPAKAPPSDNSPQQHVQQNQQQPSG
jgi:comEA protein